MKKIHLTNQTVAFLFFILVIMLWNINSAKPDCGGINQKNVCKNSLMVTQKKIAENPEQDIATGVFPFDNLLIKI